MSLSVENLARSMKVLLRNRGSTFNVIHNTILQNTILQNVEIRSSLFISKIIERLLTHLFFDSAILFAIKLANFLTNKKR